MNNTFVGAQAPDFRLPKASGEMFRLSQQRGKCVMVVFYPDDFQPVCKKQLCAYQLAKDKFEQYGVEIVGISKNSETDHMVFKGKFKIDFDLLSDPFRDSFKQYGVTSMFMLGGHSRAVFIINQSGEIVYRYVEPSTLSYRGANELVGILDDLRNAGKI